VCDRGITWQDGPMESGSQRDIRHKGLEKRRIPSVRRDVWTSGIAEKKRRERRVGERENW